MKTFELRVEEKMMDTLSNQLITLSVDLFFSGKPFANSLSQKLSKKSFDSCACISLMWS